jgi:hypothetical protein
VTNVHPRDLVLRKQGQEVLVEAKVVGNNSEFAVREAIGQLFAYRYFLYSMQERSGPTMLALFSEPVGDAFVDLLTQLTISAAWFDNGEWHGSAEFGGMLRLAVADLDLDALRRQIQGRLTRSESIDDVLAASEHLARRRAELLGREPTQADLEFAASILCWYPFKTPPPEHVEEDLMSIRETVVSGVSEGDTRRLDEIVPDRTLVADSAELAAGQQRGVRSFLGPAADDLLQ